MPFCKNCGINLDENAKFCNNCGFAVEKTQQESAATVTETETNELPVMPAMQVVDTTNTQSAEAPADQTVNQPSTQQPIEQNTYQQANDQSPFAQQPYVQAPTYKKTNTCALVGFILSLVSSLMCCGVISPISLIVSIIGLVQVNKSGEEGKGLSIAGIIISAIFILLLIIMVLFLIISPAILIAAFEEYQPNEFYYY